MWRILVILALVHSYRCLVSAFRLRQRGMTAVLRSKRPDRPPLELRAIRVDVEQPKEPLTMMHLDDTISDAKLSSEGRKVESKLKRLVRLLAPGEGQSYGNRTELHAAKATRKLSDPQMWTHSFFVINCIAAYQHQLFDLLLLTMITAPLSLAYHYSYEKPGVLAKMEGSAAKALFLYGLVQIFYAPSMTLKIVELFMLLLTVIIFVGTNLKPQLYESYHCLMHVVPPIWATIVAFKHTPLVRMFYSN